VGNYQHPGQTAILPPPSREMPDPPTSVEAKVGVYSVLLLPAGQ